MFGSDSALAASAEANSASWSFQDHIEVHTEDTGEGVILNAQINVLLDTEAKAAGVGEVSLPEFSVLDLKTSLKDLIGFFASDGHMCCNFFVSLDPETSDGIPSS